MNKILQWLPNSSFLANLSTNFPMKNRSSSFWQKSFQLKMVAPFQPRKMILRFQVGRIRRSSIELPRKCLGLNKVKSSKSFLEYKLYSVANRDRFMLTHFFSKWQILKLFLFEMLLYVLWPKVGLSEPRCDCFLPWLSSPRSTKDGFTNFWNCFGLIGDGWERNQSLLLTQPLWWG